MENSKEELGEQIIKIKAAIFDAETERQRLLNLLLNTQQALKNLNSEQPKDI